MLLSCLSRLWASPTFTTWASFVSRGSAIAIVLPLVVTKLTAAEVALWYLFATIMTLQLIADLGFSSVFSRALAFGIGGAKSVGDLRDVSVSTSKSEPNWSTVRDVHATMRRIFLGLALFWFVILGIGGYFALRTIIETLPNPATGWVSWILIWLVSTYRLYGMQYVAYLIGTNNIPVLRRAESAVWLAVLVASPIVLALDGRLISLVVVNYGLVAANTAINSRLAGGVEKLAPYKSATKINMRIMQDIWPRVWRSGIGLLLHSGAMQVAAVWYASKATATAAATYLLAWNLLRAIDQFAQAPFYTKLPSLATLQVQAEKNKQRRIAKHGMRMSAWVFVLGATGVGLTLPLLFDMLDASIRFADGKLWALMAIGGFLERYGAMHLQLYSTTNHIVWHIANGVSGLIYLVALVLLFNVVDVYALPIAQIVAAGAWYSWYSARKSYAAFGLGFVKFDLGVSVLPFMILMLYFSAQLARS